MHPERPKLETTARRQSWGLWTLLGLAVLAVTLLSAGGLPLLGGEPHSYASALPGPEGEEVMLPPPPIDDEYFPCSDCHEDEPADPVRRELDEHDNIVLAHGDLWCLDCHQSDQRDLLHLSDASPVEMKESCGDLWCLDCHQSDQRDLLHLSDASPVEMKESWRLCTRCHAKKIPDWRAGVHGKRTGSWRGPKEYRTCVFCHDPHSPLFKQLEPKPPPMQAHEIQVRIHAEQQELADAEN
jgi:hypothetical protein